MTRPNRRAPRHSPLPARRALPAPQPLRLPNGYYDPDSASFDARTATGSNDLRELMRSTTPVEVARTVRS